MSDPSALGVILNSLERRMIRRERYMRAQYGHVVGFRRAGAEVPAAILKSWHEAVARYDEARLAYNAALAPAKLFQVN